MATNSIRVEDSVKNETIRIASRMGLSFNAVVNVLLRKFNEEQGFSFYLDRAEQKPATVFDMSSEEFEAACQRAVAERDANPTMDYVTRLDADSGHIYRKYADGRVEYELD